MSNRVNLITVVCVIGFVGAFVVLTGLKGKSQPLASFTYLGTVTNLAGRSGRFSISNCCEGPISFCTCFVQFYSNGVGCLAQSPGPLQMDLRPHHVETLEFALPAGARRWHGLVSVSQDNKGFASLPARVKWFVRQMRFGFRNGVRFPTGKILDGGFVATAEVEE